MGHKLCIKKIMISLLLLFALLLAILFSALQMGRFRLQKKGRYKNTLLWDGEEYRYNEDVISFLFMGTDKVQGDNLQEDGSLNYIKGGQADTLFLVAVNTSTRDISVISIPRNTMANIVRCNESGVNLTQIFDCICLQHGYGDGQEQSCEKTVAAVSQMLNNIPINGYAAISMTSVIQFNDVVGGVDVELLEQISEEEIERLDAIESEETQKLLSQNNDTDVLRMPVGTKVHLEGRNAYYYIRWRSIDSGNSAPARNERQLQYAQAFLDQALDMTKRNPLFPLKAYRKVRSEMVTDVSIPEILYLLPIFTNLDSSQVSMYSLSGKYVLGDDYWEYYLDELQVKQLLFNLFYTEME